MAARKRIKSLGSETELLDEEFEESAEEESESNPVPAVEIVTSHEPRKPKPQDLTLSVQQYVRSRKHRWDRAAGFIHNMKQQFGGQSRKVRTEWEVLWNEFWNKPIR
jgi:hypothetical protein